MKKYLILYKPFLVFLASFFCSYFILTFMYQKYLTSFEGNKIDCITKMVGKNTQQVLLIFDSDAVVEQSSTHPYMKLFFHQKYLARIIEGCNAVSIIILFMSFIVAFSGKLIPTFLYVFGGSLLIYSLNVIRIAILSVLLFYFPKQEFILHEVLFPLFIYSVVFILWLVWVLKIIKDASKKTK